MPKYFKLGLISTILIVLASFGFIASFEYHTFHTWVTFLAISMIPTQILLAAVWKSEFPIFAGSLPQPLKGVVFSIFIIIAGLIVAPIVLNTIGGGVTPPTPFVVMFVIHSVVMLIWVGKIWHSWPITLITSNKLITGLLTLVFSYFITYVTFRLFFDFSAMQQAPFYLEALDPKGIFMAWPALAFSLTAAAFMLLLVITWEGWPFTALAKKTPAFGKQPLQGLMASILILILSYGLYSFCIEILKMDPVQFMVRVPVALIFGVFIVQNMMQGSLLSKLCQPHRGLLLTLVICVLGLVMHILYLTMAPILAGMELASGAPSYQLELWIASAQLSVTFPFIILFTGFFSFWPLQRRKAVKKDNE
ncbi:MAG: hypothetical protein KAI89_00510 [Emcibacter sp.]|nr:hypothetical protein [Emcibacter sp.]